MFQTELGADNIQLDGKDARNLYRNRWKLFSLKRLKTRERYVRGRQAMEKPF